MGIDAWNPTRSLYVPTPRYGDKAPALQNTGNFLAALVDDKENAFDAPIVDEPAVEPDAKRKVSDIPEVPEPEKTDPQVLLTQKLAANLFNGGFRDWRISDTPEVPVPTIPTPEPPAT